MAVKGRTLALRSPRWTKKSPAIAGLFLCLVALRWRRRELLDPAFDASPQAANSLVGGTGIEPVTPAV